MPSASRNCCSLRRFVVRLAAIGSWPFSRNDYSRISSIDGSTSAFRCGWRFPSPGDVFVGPGWYETSRWAAAYRLRDDRPNRRYLLFAVVFRGTGDARGSRGHGPLCKQQAHRIQILAKCQREQTPLRFLPCQGRVTSPRSPRRLLKKSNWPRKTRPGYAYCPHCAVQDDLARGRIGLHRALPRTDIPIGISRFDGQRAPNSNERDASNCTPLPPVAVVKKLGS